MILKIITGLIVFGFILWAVRARISLKRRRSIENIDSTVSSPASIALGELVAIAGGIYLSLILLASFLKISLPEKISFYSMSLDPLALIAVTIALLQPIFMTIIYVMFHKKSY